VHPKVEIKGIPANPLTGMGDDRRGVADEGTAIETIGGDIITTALKNTMLARTIVRPDNLPADPDRDVRGWEEEITDRDADTARATSLNGDGAAPNCSMNATYVVIGRRH